MTNDSSNGATTNNNNSKRATPPVVGERPVILVTEPAATFRVQDVVAAAAASAEDTTTTTSTTNRNIGQHSAGVVIIDGQEFPIPPLAYPHYSPLSFGTNVIEMHGEATTNNNDNHQNETTQQQEETQRFLSMTINGKECRVPIKPIKAMDHPPATTGRESSSSTKRIKIERRMFAGSSGVSILLRSLGETFYCCNPHRRYLDE